MRAATNPMQVSVPETGGFIVAALYKFVSLTDLPDWQARLSSLCRQAGLSGTLLLASEGINGTVAGRREGLIQLVDWLRKQPEFSDIELKFALHEECPFHRMKVRLKKEIVTMGRPDIEPASQAGTYIEPQDWNRLISEPGVLVVDTRNDYEIAIGQFAGAVNPHTSSFREFPAFAEQLASLPEAERPKKIAMYCTGGIRCEKSTALMRQYGFDEVFHLKGGILKYFEEVAEKDSLWQGECFVFDDRVAVNHRLEKGRFDMCHACRMPLSYQDKKSNAYQPGISCPHCIEKTSASQRARFAERQKQMQLARQRGETHIGSAPDRKKRAPESG
jgi:UPF0176 protein